LLIINGTAALVPSSNEHLESLSYASCVFMTSITFSIVQQEDNSQWSEENTGVKTQVPHLCCQKWTRLLYDITFV